SQTLTVVQAGASLYLTISPTANQNVGSSMGTGNVTVSSNVSWTATSNQSWLSIIAGSSGSGNGTVSYSYSENPNTSARSATITLSASGVSSQTLTITQAGLPIYLVISPEGTIDLSENSGAGSIQVSSNTDWQAISNQSWLTITSGISGTGNALINYSYSTNSSTSVRTATITVSATGLSSKTLTLNQQGITQSDLCIVPKLLVPKDQATDIATQTHFIWETVPGDNVSYNLEIYNSSDVLVYSNFGINSTNYRLLPEEALERGSVNYKFRVQANVDGQLTDWSEMRSFNTLLSNNSNLWSVGVPIGHFMSVIVYSNIGYPLIDYSCNFGSYCCYLAGINTGLKFQCTEYVLRFFWQVSRLNLHAHGLHGNANTFDNNAYLAGLRFVGKNSPELPKVGDILVWDDGYGHIAIVMSVNYDDEGNYSLTVAQQNVSAGQFVDFSMQVEHDDYSHKVIYGSKDYAGFLTPQPIFASTNPQDGGEISTTTPTIAWEYLPQGGFTIYIKEMDDNGCYQTYHTYSGYGQSFYVNQNIALTPGKNYLYRVVNNLPSGQYQNSIVYFKVSETKSGVSEEILPEKLTVRVLDEHNSPVSDVAIYSETLSGIEYRGTTGSAGLCNLSTFEKINSSDLIVCKSEAYVDVERIVEDADLESGIITITLVRNESYNSVFGAKVLAFQHGTENYNQIFTEPEVELLITAEMHNSFSLCAPDYYVENVENCSEHQVADSVIAVSLLPGTNNFRVHFYTEEDTLTIEKTLFYYPESYMEEYSQQLTVISTSALSETMLLIDGNFFDNLSGVTDVFNLTNGVHDLVFLKDGFYEYVRVYSDTTIVLDYNPTQTNQAKASNINLFPNPANSTITIQNATGKFAEIFDAAGRLVFSFKIDSDKFITDLSRLEKGIYLIRFSRNKELSYKQFVKM
ncbi:MAG: CHAP domain-containing protein, partial [Bacteroidales bacterium]|nr:CHAP domain-containing protein [Bacteroidales bacterium]